MSIGRGPRIGILGPVLRSPRHIPKRFGRSVTPYTRSLVSKYHRPRRKYGRERFKRGFSQFQNNLGKLWMKFLHSFWWLLGGAFVGVLLITIFSPLFTVREITVTRKDPRIDVELVEQALRPLFGQRMLFVRQQDVLPLLTGELPGEKRAAVPDLTSVTIEKQYPSTLTVAITPVPLVARVRILDPNGKDATAGTGATAGSGAALRDFLTGSGLLVQYLPSETPDSGSLPLIDVVDWGARPAAWTQMIEPDFLSDMRKAELMINQQFAETVTRRVLYLRAQEYHFLLQDKITLWLDRRSPIEEQLARYKLFLQAVPKGAVKSYVDLRLHDRIIYR